MNQLTNELFLFLEELQANNRKDWFDGQKKRYDGLKKQVLDWLSPTIETMRTVDLTLPEINPKDCMFRINRDVRFSADKSPYKTHIGLSISRGGKKWPGAGYYIHLAPEEIFTAAGTWMPEPEYLKNIRQEIDYCQEEYLALTEVLIGKGYQMMEEGRLTRPPKGYDKEHPAVLHLQNKHFVFIKKYSKKDALSKGFTDEMGLFAKDLSSYCDFLNRCLPEAFQGN